MRCGRSVTPPCAASTAAAVAPVASRASAPAGLDAGFARWVLARAGLDAEAYRAQSLRRRIPACVRALRARSEREAEQRLIAQPQMLPVAVSSLLIGVTGFFRDPDVFEGLRTTIVPALAKRTAGLRVWSAGCASGAELYSFAILLDQAGLLDRTYLLGTDCRSDVIEQARSGSGDARATCGIDESLLVRYFEPICDGAARPIDSLRLRIEWRVSDVLRAAEAGPWDVIFWRNTAIYLNAGPAASVCHRMAGELSPGGFLVVGKAERPPSGTDLLQVSRCIYRKRGA